MEELLDFLKSATGAAIVVGLFEWMRWRRDRKAQKEDNATKIKVVDCAARGQEIQTLNGLVENLIIANRTILYDRIKHIAKTYIKRGWCTIEELEDLKKMHQVYHDQMQGNGFLDAVMAEVEHLEKRVL